MPASRPLAERLREKYRVNAESGCWDWTASKINGGYGMISLSRAEGNVPAHRASWMVHRGPIGAGLLVCHKCDNPSCVNPDHLFLGTHADNMKDMERKGRARMLDKKQLVEARELLAAGCSQTELATWLGVARSTLARSVRLLSEGAENFAGVYQVSKYVVVSDEQKVEALKMLDAGCTVASVSRKFNVDRKTLRNWRSKIPA